MSEKPASKPTSKPASKKRALGADDGGGSGAAADPVAAPAAADKPVREAFIIRSALPAAVFMPLTLELVNLKPTLSRVIEVLASLQVHVTPVKNGKAAPPTGVYLEWTGPAGSKDNLYIDFETGAVVFVVPESFIVETNRVSTGKDPKRIRVTKYIFHVTPGLGSTSSSNMGRDLLPIPSLDSITEAHIRVFNKLLACALGLVPKAEVDKVSANMLAALCSLKDDIDVADVTNPALLSVPGSTQPLHEFVRDYCTGMAFARHVQDLVKAGAVLAKEVEGDVGCAAGAGAGGAGVRGVGARGPGAVAAGDELVLPLFLTKQQKETSVRYLQTQCTNYEQVAAAAGLTKDAVLGGVPARICLLRPQVQGQKDEVILLSTTDLLAHAEGGDMGKPLFGTQCTLTDPVRVTVEVCPHTARPLPLGGGGSGSAGGM